MSDELKESIAKILKVAKENEKSSGIYSVSGDQAREFADQGFNMVRSSITQNSIMDLTKPGFRNDRYRGITTSYDSRSDECERLICSFRTEHWKRSHVRAI